MDSPCVNVCVIDEATGFCQGCRRTLAEIATWSSIAPAERRAIMARLPDRTKPREGKLDE
jgi:uncharacterized protein